jgi:hypothetical protein
MDGARMPAYPVSQGNAINSRKRRSQTMQERVKVFTFVSGHGETVVEPAHEDHINQWLSSVEGQVVEITQSESERAGTGHHVTICIWYIPEEPSTAAPAE